MILFSNYEAGNTNYLRQEFFDRIKHAYDKNVVNNFLSSISKSLQELRETLLNDPSTSQRNSYEYYEQTPLLRYPLLKLENVYVNLHPKLLYRCLEHYVYDTLKEWNSSKFMNKFGPIFEKYVNNSIDSLNLPYLTEKQLKALMPRGSKVIDYFIRDREVNILLDSKGVEVGYKGKVTHRADILLDKVEVAAISAIEQALATLQSLKNNQIDHPIFLSSETNYLIVVTFKELYLGNGTSFYEVVAKNKLDKIYTEYDRSLLPLENIYFLTIDEWEKLVEISRTGDISLSERLAVAVDKDKNPQSMKFEFDMHLHDWQVRIPILPFLEERFDMVFNQIEKKLSN